MPSIEVQHQPLEAPLNDTAVRTLANLNQTYASDRKLQDHLRNASNLLASSVSDINEAKIRNRDKHDRQNGRLVERGAEPNADDDIKEFEARVDTVTEKMDLAIRRLIDDRVWTENLSDTLKHVSNRSTEATATQTQRSTQLPTQDVSPRRREFDEGGNEIDAEDDEDDSVPTGPPPPEEAPTALLAAALASQNTRHTSKSLTDRYAHDNDYAGFYRALHDARHSNRENKPPVPAPALWFGREEGQLSSTLPADALADEDTELGVVAERTRIKCPITLQPFKNPVTSDSCHHSYEKSAILDMLKTSDEFLPATPEQEAQLLQFQAQNPRIRAADLARKKRQIYTPRVKCPECALWVTEAELRDNPVLQRQVKRALEQARRQQQEDEDADEGSDDGEDPSRGTQRRPFGVGSSPVARDRLSGVARVKKEMAGRARRGTQPVEMEESSDEG